MYYAIACLLFLLSVVVLIATPFVAVRGNYHQQFFCLLWTLAFVSQLFMYEPGSNVSPYAFTVGSLSAIRFFGLTLSAIACGVVALFAALSCFSHFEELSDNAIVVVFLPLLPNLVGVLVSGNLLGSVDSLVKVLSPFLLLVFMDWLARRNEVGHLGRLLTAINVFVIAQIGVCRLLTGHFAAYNFYYELTEEYFGYFNHAHLFAGTLLFLCIWSLYNVGAGSHRTFHTVIASLDLLLIYLSGARTYLVALFGAVIVFICVYLLRGRGDRRARIVALICVVVCVIGAIVLLLRLSGTRSTDDFSSGRLDRWAQDLTYIMSNYGPLQVLFGGGIGSIESINLAVADRSINSLNLFIDLLADYGIIGMLLIVAAYIGMFRIAYSSSAATYQIAVMAAFAVTAMINSLAEYAIITSEMVVMLIVMREYGEGRSVEDPSVESSAVSRDSRE